MKRFAAVLATLSFLGACSGDGTNPFDPPTAATTDPSTINNKYLFDLTDKLTMNSVTYDQTNNELLINNLPFDGPSQRYEHRRLQNGVDVFRSIQTPTTGRVRSYAVFMKNANAEVTAAVGETWAGFGYAGANVKRAAYGLPSGVGEYVYLGTYGAVRTRDDGPRLELVTGDVELLLDTGDFDPTTSAADSDTTLEGAIVGSVRNRLRTDPDGNAISNQLPNISLVLVQYDPATGSFVDGEVTTYFGLDVRDTGEWEGLISGPQGETLAGYVVMTGTAEIQNVRYEVIDWTNPVTGETGTAEGYTTEEDYDRIFALVNAGQQVPLETAVLPAGAVANGPARIEEIQFESTAEAREVGVFSTNQQPTNTTPLP
ncbi:hypothetical protein [Lentibacter sp.]|uniref:hypothetical protein n=1 Tax=Lentibacter sp. TaxID=2024994 RepID=UPI003F69D7B5